MASGRQPQVAPEPQTRAGRVPARRVVFAPVPSTDATRAVVRRLRAAIGLGLLTSGERLPRESDLAGQLGVTTFSLREALGELRRQQLIVTRPGKHGGSFVSSLEAPEALGHNDLLALSAADLRDMGDWRSMLVSSAAALAASRGSDRTFDTLGLHADQVRDAESGQQARRAHGRFHVELASAAQSMRMTRAEFAAHEEADWLFGYAMSTAEQREATARDLVDVVDALRRRDPAAARAAAERQARDVTDELVRLRLELLAAARAAEDRPVDSDLEDEVTAYCTSLVAVLDTIASQIAPVLAGDGPETRLRQEVAVAILQQAGGLPASVRGVGVNAEVGVVAQAPYWIEWWDITDTGPAHSDRHVVEPGRDDFYDYEDMEFIAQPRASSRAWAAGPYVDLLGADEYIVSFAAPVLHEDRFLGVVVADVPVGELERHLAPWLATADRLTTLVDHDSRVIVSNALLHGAGEVVADPDSFVSTSLAHFGWRVLQGRPAAASVERRR